MDGRARCCVWEQACGGGYGDPLERDPEAVLRDYLDEFITPWSPRERLRRRHRARDGATRWTPSPRRALRCAARRQAMSLSYPEAVEVVEVGPRDGLQSLPAVVPTARQARASSSCWSTPGSARSR